MVIPTITYQEKLWRKGLLNIAGVDEVGRGPLAGPVMAAAVVINNKNQVVKSVRDSKLMSSYQREKVFLEICDKSSAFGIGKVEALEIDKIGIHVATKKAMLKALIEVEKKLRQKLDYVLVDGSKTMPLESFPHERILKGGLYHYSIACASVIAKVTRDRLMEKLAEFYPEYNFEKHAGYGTAIHLQRIKQFGPCPIHRMSFAPLKK